MITFSAGPLADLNRIAISCIGTSFGQSVIASLRRLGANSLAFGLHESLAAAYTWNI